MSSPRRLSILGSTGSVGTQTLDVVRLNPDVFEVYALSANKNADLILTQIREFKPSVVAIADADTAHYVKREVGASVDVRSGIEAIEDISTDSNVDIVVAALVGFACLKPVLRALESGKDVAIANKESLVAAGSLLKRAIASSSARLVPVDSEHNSLYQCLQNSKRGFRRMIITASGGPFLHHSLEELRRVTPAEAIKHPRWDMGAKISVDSATLMNKGLEVIEAAVLFDLEPDEIEVLVHPQSIVHGLLEYLDGSTHAVMYEPDMKVPIADALGRLNNTSNNQSFKSIPNGCKYLDFSIQRTLEFMPPDLERFPCLKLAYDSLRKGHAAPTILNAANEVAVEAYLAENISFIQIPVLVEEVLAKYDGKELASVDDILHWDSWARELALEWVSSAA